MDQIITLQISVYQIAGAVLLAGIGLGVAVTLMVENWRRIIDIINGKL